MPDDPHRHHKPANPLPIVGGSHAHASSPAPGAKDPVCGMTVDPARAAGYFDHAGTTYYFCSVGCLEKFKADSAKYLAAVGQALQPVHVEGPPASGTPLAPTSATEYTCPMHPEIVRPAPGACPICGMALEPRTVTAT